MTRRSIFAFIAGLFFVRKRAAKPRGITATIRLDEVSSMEFVDGFMVAFRKAEEDGRFRRIGK